MKLTKKILTAAVSSTLLLTSCADWFENRIAMDISTRATNLAALVVQKQEITQLDAPAQIFVSQAESSSMIYISWAPVVGATSYYLEKAVSKTKDAYGDFIPPEEDEYQVVPLASKIYSTQFTDVILTNPDYTAEEYSYGYFYRVCAENPRLKYESSEFITSEAAYLLAPPSGVTASLGEAEDHITVKWTKAAGAKSYDVYRSLNADGSSSVKIGSVTADRSQFTNYIGSTEQGVDYYFTVITRTNTGSSVQSSIALGYALQAGAPPAVSGVHITNGRGTTTNKINIEWDAASGVKYAIYRTSSKDSSLTLLKKELETPSYEDTKALKPNVFYYYQVQAYTSEGSGDSATIVKGPFSASGKDSENPAEGYIIGPPAEITVSKSKVDSTKCIISLSPALGSKQCSIQGVVNTYNNYFYEVSTSDTKDGNYTLINNSNNPFAESSLQLIDGYLSITVDSARFYKVQTKNGDAKSAYSEPCAPAPFAARNPQASQAAFIAGYTNSDSNANDMGVHAVKLTWEAPSENDADGGYYIYRSAKKDSGFKKITEEPVMGTSYIDANESAKAGVYYYYKVLSLNSLKQGANYTEPVAGWGALTAEQYMREYNKTVITSQKRLTLMHKSDDMAKLGSESANGGLCGTLSYNAAVQGLGARITMHYTNYAEYWANGDQANGYYFFINGDTNTSASMDASGTMDGTVTCEGMYPGSVNYNNLKIKGGAAGGGTYGITRQGFSGTVNIDWKIGEEGK